MEDLEDENHHISLPSPPSTTTTTKGPSRIPSSSSSIVLKDLSNDFKTPKRSNNNPPFPSRTPHQFHVQTTPRSFTASKQTPSPSFSIPVTDSAAFSTARQYRRLGSVTSTSKSRAAVRKLMEFEIEQSRTARKELAKKERSLRSLAKSLSVWLNFLFEDPRLCGCRVLGDDDWVDGSDGKAGVGIGKRQSWGRRSDGVGGFSGVWRVPKRLKEGYWRESGESGGYFEEIGGLKFALLRDSLREVCSLEDLKERMRGYLSSDSCNDVFTVMTHVAKNIDEGRLKMKAHCPMVTDVGMKQKAINVLMCYNPIWLRIGLYIILGGESLLPNEDPSTEQEIAFLRIVLGKQVFSHGGLAKAYAYNKLVDGLYRPGYFELLGNVILKRFLLLLLILDRAKSDSCLPIQYGIDGLDGGSPLLFTSQSWIKSSRQMLTDFLSSDVMHGEGNLVAHLTQVGYKVNYQQLPLIEYDFGVTDLFQDIQDGLRLCRAIQLLQNDSSILEKLVLPADAQKRKLLNCRVAMKYLKQAGVPLVDDDGNLILEEDIASGDKELTLSLLWNIFVHLQMPILITKAVISDEITRIRKAPIAFNNMEASTHLDLLLNWMKAICENYDFKVDTFTSMVDGKAMWCLLDFYFRKELNCSCAQKDLAVRNSEESIVSRANSTDAVHNFMLSQKLTTLLGNFPEVLQISDILENNGACNDRSVVILLVFLSSQLLIKKSKNQLNFHKLMGCPCQTLERRRSSTGRLNINFEMTKCEEDQHSTEDAAKNFNAIQAWWQEMAKRNNQIIEPIVQSVFLYSSSKCNTEIHQGDDLGHQQSNGAKEMNPMVVDDVSPVSKVEAVDNAREEAAKKIQLAWRKKVSLSKYTQCSAATKIQRHVCGWITRGSFIQQKQSVLNIQSSVRYLGPQRNLLEHIAKIRSAIVIQSHVRGWICRRGVSRCRCCIILIQSHCRGWLARKILSSQKQAAVVIQSSFRAQKCWDEFSATRHAAIQIQCLVRGTITRTRLLGSASLHSAAWRDEVSLYSPNVQNIELKIVHCSIVKLQKWWRKVSVNKLRTKATIVIQSHTRGWIDRERVRKERNHIVLIQSYWKGYLGRRDEKRELLDLRLRVQKSAVNVDDGMRIINRHISALNELVSMKSLSNILRICATLDRATEVSQKCCEMLVEAGAIDILLKQIRSVSRSIPDQEVLKHGLSILKNLARYSHLTDVVIDHPGSVETVFWELLRNKEDGFFIACDLLKKTCLRQKGIERVCSQTHLLKRLRNIVDELSRKASHRKRNHRGLAAVLDTTERRLKEADELLRLISRRHANI